LEQGLSLVLLFERRGEIETDQFQQSPLDIRPNISEGGVADVVAVFHEDVPSSSDYFSAL
jgi:hypothetical protein